MAPERARLLELLIERSFARRKIVLSSGRESDFYIDCKKTILTAEGHWLVGTLMLAEVKQHFAAAVAVGGLTMGADPIASAVATVSFHARTPLHAFLVRKEPKGHGTGQWVEGLSILPAHAPVVIVEDVITTGASTLRAIERARAEGLEPLGAIALVDREEGGADAIAEAKVPVRALFRRSDFP